MRTRALKFSSVIRGSLQEVLPGLAKSWFDCGCIITDVAMTKDLSIAKVFIMNHTGDAKEILAELNQISKIAAHKVSKQNKFRRVPTIRFLADESYAEAKKMQHLQELLQQDTDA